MSVNLVDLLIWVKILIISNKAISKYPSGWMGIYHYIYVAKQNINEMEPFEDIDVKDILADILYQNLVLRSEIGALKSLFQRLISISLPLGEVEKVEAAYSNIVKSLFENALASDELFRQEWKDLLKTEFEKRGALLLVPKKK